MSNKVIKYFVLHHAININIDINKVNNIKLSYLFQLFSVRKFTSDDHNEFNMCFARYRISYEKLYSKLDNWLLLE